MPDPVIHAEALSRSYRVPVRREGLRGAFRDLIDLNYREVAAVREVSFTVERGERVAYIGPNGAGKSTTVKMLCGILKPSAGKLRVLGYDPYRERERFVHHIGVVFGQRTALWWDLAVLESLRLLQRIYRVDEATFQAQLARFNDVLGLDKLLALPARKLSLGQRVIADIAAALLHQPPVVFLDEPTIGLDVAVKGRIRTFLKSLSDEGTTVLLTTHDLGDVEALAERVLVIDQGQLIFDGPSLELRRDLGEDNRLVVQVDEGERARLDDVAAALALSWDAEGSGRYSAKYDSSRISTPDLVRQVLENVDVKDLELRSASMEDVVRDLYERRGR